MNVFRSLDRGQCCFYTNTPITAKSNYLSVVRGMCHSKNSKTRIKIEYVECYKELQLDENCDQEQLRSAFVKLAKIYHPDSGYPEADAVKFQKIDNAYKTLLQKFSKDRWSSTQGEGEYGLYYQEKKDEGDFEIKHIVPQHRQYLNYEGIGVGTPSQRQKQYQKHKAIRAAENIYEHRTSKLASQTEDTLLVKDKRQQRKHKTKYGIDRLVEDLIQESMAKGEFDNLSGKGKPLSSLSNYNPYVDFTTHKINQVLIDNGFVPPWISLLRDINWEIKNLKVKLEEKRSLLGPYPLSSNDEKKWEDTLQSMNEEVQKLNSKISDFNLVVPLITKQMFIFQLEKEGKKILIDGKSNDSTSVKHVKLEDSKHSFLDVFSFIFRW